MKTRKFGTLEISAVGLGCMGFTHGYGTCPSEEESIRLIRKAYDEGCTASDKPSKVLYDVCKPTISTFTRNTVCPKRMIPQRLPIGWGN